MKRDELPYHRWPRSWGGWQAGSIIRCEGQDCQFCKARWKLVDNETLKDVDGPHVHHQGRAQDHDEAGVEGVR